MKLCWRVHDVHVMRGMSLDLLRSIKYKDQVGIMSNIEKEGLKLHKVVGALVKKPSTLLWDKDGKGKELLKDLEELRVVYLYA